MLSNFREKLIPILLGWIFTFSFAFLLYINPTLVSQATHFLENLTYDLKLRYTYKPLNPNTPIAILDIDDKSLAAEGRWPWSRKKLATLIQKLYEKNATVIAFDMIFSEKELNLAQELLKTLSNQKKNSTIDAELKSLEPLFDYDKQLADTLKKGETVLAFSFHPSKISEGAAPTPLLTLLPEQKLSLPKKLGYLSNIPILQQAAKKTGFINASLDSDGVIRYSPLICLYENGIYPSLALQATSLYLLQNHFALITHPYLKNEFVLEGIQLEDRVIPTDPWGRILVPFRGPPYSFTYLSATDLLHDQIPRKKIANKLIFIGTSAIGMGDLFPTAIFPVFAGAEIHASIAAGILEGYLPYKPAWGKGLSLACALGVGLVGAFIFPFLGPISNTFSFLLFSLGLGSFELILWRNYNLVVSLAAPFLTLFFLYLLNILYGYFVEKRKRKEIKQMFGQYVPPSYLEVMLKTKKKFDLQGENKELTVLFTDIRGFTSLSEKLSASQIKEFLNEYLTPMTQVIFDHQGTIDKYVGDMIMAFWGDPLPDTQHASHAVSTALAMQKKLQELSKSFEQKRQLTIQAGVGINTGMMNVGDMGSQFRRAYTVLGDAVNLASRLESLTKYYHIWIIVGEATQKQAKEFIFHTLDKVQVKGKKQSVRIYEPICHKQELNETLQKKLHLHEEALKAYWSKEWESAKELFQKLIDLSPERKLFYQIFQERIQGFERSPPPPDWDGTHILESRKL